MSFDPSMHHTSTVRCPCGNEHPANYRLSVCAHPCCIEIGCEDCFSECGASAGCGMFCEDHTNTINMGTAQRPCVVQACPRCESEIADEAEVEQRRLAA